MASLLMNSNPTYLAICTNRRLTDRQPSCGGRGALELAHRLQQILDEQGIELPLHHSECLGHCRYGPNLRLAPGGQILKLESSADTATIIDWLKQELAL